MLSGSLQTEPVTNKPGPDSLALVDGHPIAIAGMFGQKRVDGWVAELVKLDAVDLLRFDRLAEWVAALLGFMQDKIKLDRMPQISVLADHSKSFTVLIVGACDET